MMVVALRREDGGVAVGIKTSRPRLEFLEIRCLSELDLRIREWRDRENTSDRNERWRFNLHVIGGENSSGRYPLITWPRSAPPRF